MNRKRKSSTPKRIPIQEPKSFGSDLPNAVLQSILLKLPTKSILMCKTVCKGWCAVISDPELAKLHFAQAEACPLVRPAGPSRVSRTLYLIESEDDSSGIDLTSSAGDSNTSWCKHIHLPMTSFKCKIPLRDAEEAIAMLNREGVTKRKPVINMHSVDHKYLLVNSCNGLLCLAEPFLNDPHVVCNPITGEFINLPEASKQENQRSSFSCALGFSPRSKQYKVIRIFDEPTSHHVRTVELHILGTHEWKCVPSPPFSVSSPYWPTYLKGKIYWSHRHGPYHVASFDCDDEEFQSVLSPPFQQTTCYGMGVLGGSLCVCDGHGNQIDLWLMEGNGAQNSWTKRFTITAYAGVSLPVDGLFMPIKYTKDGGVLMFHCPNNTLVYYHPRNFRSLTILKLGAFAGYFEAISHAPSFISLRDILMGSDVQVLNINSRCAECKVAGETKDLELVNVAADETSDHRSSEIFRMKRGNGGGNAA